MSKPAQSTRKHQCCCHGQNHAEQKTNDSSRHMFGHYPANKQEYDPSAVLDRVYPNDSDYDQDDENDSSPHLP